MSVRLDSNRIYLEGDCRVAEAETLTSLLQADAARIVDLDGCRSLHAALVQTLLAFRPAIEGKPEDSFIKTLLLPSLCVR